MQINEETGTCEVLLLLPILAPKILMMRIVERVAAATMIRQTPGGNPSALRVDTLYFASAAEAEGI